MRKLGWVGAKVLLELRKRRAIGSRCRGPEGVAPRKPPVTFLGRHSGPLPSCRGLSGRD